MEISTISDDSATFQLSIIRITGPALKVWICDPQEGHRGLKMSSPSTSLYYVQPLTLEKDRSCYYPDFSTTKCCLL
jgi:hypothetical protein